MIDQKEARQLIGADLYAASDQKVGRIGQIFLDDQTNQPEWATVQTGFFGTSESFVPLQGAQRVSSGLAVPYEKEKIKNAPNIDPVNGHLSEGQEAELYSYYGLPYSEARSESGLPDGGPSAGTQTDVAETGVAAAGTAQAGTAATGNVEADLAAADLDAAREKEGLLRSEEQLHVGKERVEAGRVRLRKYVVTEEENITVPVQKEKVRLETETLTGEDQMVGDEITEGETEVTLSEERPVVHKETVAKERVGLVKEVEEQQQTVSEDVRKERIEVEGDIDRDR